MPTTDQVHARRWMIPSVLNLSLLLIVLDNAIVNMAPIIHRDLDTSHKQAGAA